MSLFVYCSHSTVDPDTHHWTYSLDPDRAAAPTIQSPRHTLLTLALEH